MKGVFSKPRIVGEKVVAVVGVSSYDGRNLVPPRPGNHLMAAEENWRKWGQDADGYNRFYPIVGDSNDPAIADLTLAFGPFDCCFIDADHAYEACKKDLELYAPMVKPGGLLVCDDSAVHLNLPDGVFRGFEGSSWAVDERLPPKTENADWEYLGNVAHLRAWRRR